MRKIVRLVAIALALGAWSCGGSQKKTEYDVLKVPDERTATTWIARAFKKNGFDAEADRVIKISATGDTITADVAAIGDKWSVVWLRPDELQDLKDKLPPPPPGVADGALWVHRGVGDDADQRMLILVGKSYEYDPDPRGEGVVHSIEASEARCIRDVNDFLVRAKAGEIE
jgi:hypothetical protein